VGRVVGDVHLSDFARGHVDVEETPVGCELLGDLGNKQN